MFLISLQKMSLLWFNMNVKVIDGKKIASDIKSAIKEKIQKDYIDKGKNVPCLACVIVEGNAASEVYVASKKRACEECGINSEIVRLPNDITQDNLQKEIEKLNKDKNVSGILLQLPLPKQLDSISATNFIDPSKDVDCLTFSNLGKLFSASHEIAPCTATGILKILDSEKIEIAGKRAVVIGRSLLVGKRVANLLEQRNATVTICHSKTQNLEEITKQADILIVAIGKAEFITKDYVKDGCVVIDVGTNRTETGLKGDVLFDDVKDKCSFITKVPGGVGPLTVACLLENTLILHEKREEKI